MILNFLNALEYKFYSSNSKNEHKNSNLVHENTKMSIKFKKSSYLHQIISCFAFVNNFRNSKDFIFWNLKKIQVVKKTKKTHEKKDSPALHLGCPSSRTGSGNRRSRAPRAHQYTKELSLAYSETIVSLTSSVEAPESS